MPASSPQISHRVEESSWDNRGPGSFTLYPWCPTRSLKHSRESLRTEQIRHLQLCWTATQEAEETSDLLPRPSTGCTV